MNLSSNLKTSLCISINANIINDQIYKSLLENSFSELVGEQITRSPIDSSKPDIIKELHAAFLTLIAEFTRHNLTKENIQSVLSECNFTSDRSNLFCEIYEKYKYRLQIVLGNIGTHLPHIVDVKWSIDYVVKSSGIDEAEGPIFRVCLFTEVYDEKEKCNELQKINFSCTSQEMQDLVYRLKEAVRHCQKVAVEH